MQNSQSRYRRIGGLLSVALLAIAIIAYAIAISPNWYRSADVTGKIRSPPAHTWIVDDDGPAHFHTIQEAINAANQGDIILVKNGTYYEHVVANKTVSLIGEERSATIIDGIESGTVIHVTANNTMIREFTIRNSAKPAMEYTPISDTGILIFADYGQVVKNTTIINNNVRNNHVGLFIQKSIGNTIIGNRLEDNFIGVGIDEAISNSIDRNYVSNNAGGVWLSSGGNRVSKNNISSNSAYGVQIDGSSFNTVDGNNIENNGYGIELIEANSNNITRNIVTNNIQYGVSLGGSNNNLFYHNNFINNTSQVYTYNSVNVWDDGYPSGGNYWSDYAGVDEKSGFGQDLPGSDGIGDTPYVIDDDNRDLYPLMSPWTPAPPEVHDVATVSVLPSATEVYVGHVVNVTVVVRNEGNASETFTVTCKYELEGVEHLIGTQTVDNLAPDTNTTLTFNWTTTDVTVHTIKVEIQPLVGETDTADNKMTSPVTVKVKLLGDFNNDDSVDILDCVAAAAAFGTYLGHPGWNPQADLNQDNAVDIFDIILMGRNFGKSL